MLSHVKSSLNTIFFVSKNISESWNCNVAKKYFAIFEKNSATIFKLQWNIGNISDIFLQYSLLVCGPLIFISINNKDLQHQLNGIPKYT